MTTTTTTDRARPDDRDGERHRSAHPRTTPEPTTTTTARSAGMTQQTTDAPSRPAPAAARPAAPTLGRRLVDRKWFVIVGGAIIPVIVLLTWHLVSENGIVPTSQLPSPTMVWLALIDLIERGLFWQYVAISTQRVLIGFAIGATLGLLFGAIVGLSKLGDILLTPTLGALRAVPSLAWLPLLILWLKLGEESKITLIIIGSFFPVYTVVASALRHVDRQLIEAARAFGLHGTRLFGTVQLPAVIPETIAGLRLALAQAWLFLVAAELLGASMGLGFLLTDSTNTGRLDRTFLAIILLAVIGKLSDSLIGVFERWAVRRWT
nr:ABC transporter permease [Agromyces mangrovi]